MFDKTCPLSLKKVGNMSCVLNFAHFKAFLDFAISIRFFCVYIRYMYVYMVDVISFGPELY